MHPSRFAPTRRRFVSLAAAAGGAVLLHPTSLLAGPRRERLSFIVVSDTHLGYRDKESAARQWRQTAAEIAEAEGDLVLHLGDVVDGGREEQYPIYLEARQRIGKPVHEIPGNHDPAELFAKHLRRQIDAVVDHGWLRFLLLNNARRDSHDGFLSDEQIAWIDQQCQAAAKDDRLVAICMHVPAHANKHPDRGWYVKPENGQSKLYETLAAHRGTVLALMHGHFHNGIRGWDDHAPVHEICFPSALYNGDRHLEEQHAPGYNPLEFRPGFTLVTIEDGAMKLRYKVLGGDVGVEKVVSGEW
ncbi:MAG: metallophosphoesterase [Pirellulaceae bacterium]